MQNSELLTMSQAAARLGVTRMTIWRRVKQGKLPSTVIGGVHFISPTDLPTTKPAMVPQTDLARTAVELTVKQYGDVLKRLGAE